MLLRLLSGSAIAAAVFVLAGCNGTEMTAKPSYGFANQTSLPAEKPTGKPAPSAKTSIPAGAYIIEFRARTGPDIIGHTYMVFGKQGQDGSIAEPTQVGLYPSDVTGFVTGVFGTSATTEPVELDRAIKPSIVYRKEISEAQYTQLQAEVEAARANPPTWSWTGYNCNSFVADMAQRIGLKAPAGATLMAPGFFVVQMRMLNA